MKVDVYEERGDDKYLSITHNRSRITARSERKRGVRVSFAKCARSEAGDDDRVDVSFDDCYSCEDWHRLLCELGRICGCSPCEPWGDWTVTGDGDDCRERGVSLSVREIKEAIKGLHADDIVLLTGGDCDDDCDED